MPKVKYPVFYTEKNGVPCVIFYDFGLIVTRSSKSELVRCLQGEFDQYAADQQKAGLKLPAPTPLNKLDKNKYKGEIAYMEMNVEKKMTEKEIEKSLARVKANFAIEEMDMTDEEIDRGRRFMRGDITFEEGMKELIENFGEDQ